VTAPLDDMDIERARMALDRVIEVVPHTDADGLAAAAIVLRALGRPADDALLLGRGRSPWSSDVQLVMPALLDWGMRERPGPALIIDHHAPEAVPRPDQVVLSGHRADPEISTSVLAHRVCPVQPRWLAMLGAVGDLGDRAFALPEAGAVPKTAIRRLVPLLNAPRRGPDGAAIRTALVLLVEHDDPKAILADPRIAELQAAREAWQAAWQQVRRTAPQVGLGAALVRFSSPFQLHPLAAQMWSRRLAPRPVIGANDGYIPGRVNFSIRGGDGDLRALLLQALPDVGGEFAHGHPRATGGSLTPPEFERLLTALDLA
jgi:single-stranded-DNA-specific exonuclease